MNALTLDKLLTRLTEEVPIPEQEDEVLRAVSLVGKNTGIAGEPVWCLNQNLSIGKDGFEVEASHHGLEWLSHLTESGNGGEIADETVAAKVEGELTKVYFDAMAHLLAGSLEKKIEEDTQLKVVVNELFGTDECLCFPSQLEDYELQQPQSPEIDFPADGVEKGPEEKPTGEMQRDNFLSQFYLASMGVVMANYQEASTLINL